MELIDLARKSPAVVVGPGDTVIVKIDRYLTGQQLEVIQGVYQKKLPNTRVMVIQKGMDIEVIKAAVTAGGASVPPSGV